LEAILFIGGCVIVYLIYVKHQAAADIEAVYDVIYRLTQRLKLAQAEGYHEDHDRIEWMVKWIDLGLSTKRAKQRLSAEERPEVAKAASIASTQRILNLIAVYPGTSQYSRYSGALMRLAATAEK
jgi:hypothetical protein